MSVTPAAAGTAATDRPGTKFFAPQVRLVDESEHPIRVDGQSVSQDVISAKVTQVNSGVSQVEIVLNNQRHDASHRPLVPTWRYNALSGVSFGSRVRVDYRYGGETWTPMILARVTDVGFLFPQAAGAQVTLQGEDLLSLLKTKPARDTLHENKHEIAIVADAVSDSGSGLALASPRPAPAFGAVLRATTHQGSQTYLQFIDSLAERMDYEVFVDFAAGGASVELHFEPARSVTLNLSETVELAWGRDLLDFKPAFKGWDLLTDAVVTGSVPGRRGTFSPTVTMATAINDLHAAPGGDTPLSASAARASAFDNENRPDTNTERVTVTNLDEQRATMQGSATLRRSARQFLTADITTLGFTSLRPGIHVNLSGFKAPFDGIYYVTQAVHTLSAAGYLTVSSLRRPGMLDPANYPGS